jgi:Tfp pilus assembly protein PilZ
VTRKHPAEEARDLIGKALAAVQDDPAAESSLGLLASTLAGAQSNLFDATKFNPSHPLAIEDMRKAMEYLARSLQLLQDIKASSAAVGVASSSVAKSLATLYTATQSVRAPSVPPPPPGLRPPLGGLPPPPPIPGRSPPPGGPRRSPGAAPPPSEEDRRLRTLQLQVESTLDMQSDTQFYTGLSGRIDEGGIFVATFDIKPINSKISVSFNLPGGETIVARGFVRWVREYNPVQPNIVPGMGVGFSELGEKDRRAIERYLEQRAPLFYDDE